MFEVNLLFYGSSGGHKNGSKSFELLANMYHEIKNNFPKLARSWIKGRQK